MQYLFDFIGPEGAYGPPQSNPFNGAIPLTDEQTATVIQYNGFVTITSHEEEYEEGFFRTVYGVTPNTEAWEAWKAGLPPAPEPEPVKLGPNLEDRVAGIEDAIERGLIL